MKKKIFIGMAALFFAAVTFYNVQVSQQDRDISLENVALMAQAADETPQYDCPNGKTECVRVTVGNNVTIYYKK